MGHVPAKRWSRIHRRCTCNCETYAIDARSVALPCRGQPGCRVRLDPPRSPKARWQKRRRLTKARQLDSVSIELSASRRLWLLLPAAGHASAAQLLGAGEWTLDGASVRVSRARAMGKKMLSLTVNAAAEKIIRQELQRLGAPARFLVVAGAGRPPWRRCFRLRLRAACRRRRSQHPLVQRAKEIFKAEVRSVVDLRQK